jgi:hypothetical protein
MKINEYVGKKFDCSVFNGGVEVVSRVAKSRTLVTVKVIEEMIKGESKFKVNIGMEGNVIGQTYTRKLAKPNPEFGHEDEVHIKTLTPIKED